MSRLQRAEITLRLVIERRNIRYDQSRGVRLLVRHDSSISNVRNIRQRTEEFQPDYLQYRIHQTWEAPCSFITSCVR